MNSISIIITPMDFNEHHIADFNSIWGEIYLQCDGVCFPDSAWHDAISSMLCMWLSEINDLLAKSKPYGKLYFMDGPYEIKIIVLDYNMIECRCMFAEQVQIIARVSFESFLKALVESTTAFISNCQSNLRNPASCKVLMQIESLLNELVYTIQVKTGIDPLP